MDRRLFLRTLGITGAGLVAGCTPPTDSASDGATPTTSGTELSLDDLVTRIAPQADQDLSVIVGSFEQLTGQAQPFAFALSGADNEPFADADVELYVIPNGGQVSGPTSTEFREVPGNPLGVYVAQIDLTQPGATAFVAVTADEGHAGVAAVEVRTIENSPLPAPTEPAPAVATATLADPGAVERLCTRQPPCPMHEISLDTALAEGRPVMIEFATPAYCQTAICGPSVDVMDQARTSRDWGDTAWIHVEIYSDAGQTLAAPVQEWGLPSEPWIFAIGRDGTIAGRADGPLLVLPDHIASLAEQIQ